MDDHAFVACVALAWPERWEHHTGSEVEIRSMGLPFDQGLRDKRGVRREKQPLNLLDAAGIVLESGEDPNLPEKDWEQLLEWLRGREIVMHNGKYDCEMMLEGTREMAGADLSGRVIWDTMLGAGVLDPTEPRGLDEVSKRMGRPGKQGLDAVKAWLKRHKLPTNRYDLAPWSEVKKYVTTDAEETAAAYIEQRVRMEETGQSDQMDREMRLMRTLMAMEQRGVSYDSGRSLEAAEVLDARADAIEEKMPFKCKPNDAKRYFFEQRGLKPVKYTDKGAPSLDEEAVRQWVKDGVEWAAEYADAVKIRRAVSMHFRGYAEKVNSVDGRLRCSYKQGHVRSGRMSVERAQLQAIPKADKNLEGVPGIRQLLRAEPGYGLWSLDFSQAELRVATKYSGCVRMAELLAQGADLHGVTTETVMNVSREDPLWKEKRDIGKRLTFGGIFQIGGQKFQETLAKLADIHLPLAECEAYVRRWRGMYPEFGRAYRRAERVVQDRGWVRLLPGTEYEVRSQFGREDYPNTGWNRIVQGSLAEFFKLFLVGVEERWPGCGPRAVDNAVAARAPIGMILCIHDSVVLELPEGEGDEVARQVAAWGGAFATELFSTEMKVDVDRWYQGVQPPDKGTKGDDVYETMRGHK